MMTNSQLHDPKFVERWVCEQRPSVVVVGGWAISSFTALARSESLRGVRFILGFDNPWTGTLKQRVAPYVLYRYLNRFSCVVVPGERARQFARRLVPQQIPVETGLYGFASEALSLAAEQRRLAAMWPKRFLFMGRYEAIKGIEILVSAYRKYRQRHTDPWPLTVCGRGPLRTLFTNVPGLIDQGFVSPREQPGIFAKHGALLLSSVYDPWPLVLGEGCAAGLPILCTEACGSAVEMVRQGYNGFVVPTGCSEQLAQGMAAIHGHFGRLPEMGRRSEQLAYPFAASAWAEHWNELVHHLRTV